ncbi:MAG: DUF1573 domain-containing protein [Cyclobacteriaceae bacterium]|nr:DUF1573 domain-containing protein [Cyclobacteriaceae bacterium]
MKKTVLMMVALAFVVYGFAQEAKPEAKANGPVLTFEKNTHDFGDIYQNDKVEHIFKFTNTGNEPLLISNVYGTCGCTAPEWPRQPIHPGAKGEIKVRFDSTGKMGRQNKTVTVISNASNDDATISFVTNILSKTPQH